MQFLPDVDIPCPDCGGTRYGRDASVIKLAGDLSLPEILGYTVDQAREALAGSGMRSALAKLRTLSDLGLGYLTLGEATPALSGGEAQRLKLASELTRSQDDALFVFDEPTIGLHPLDVEVLLGVLQRLIDHGATVVVIEHDLDMIANADYVIDLGPGGRRGGRPRGGDGHARGGRRLPREHHGPLHRRGARLGRSGISVACGAGKFRYARWTVQTPNVPPRGRQEGENHDQGDRQGP